ncbi:MAG TPA: glycosyltransferase family 1 protein [Candidatus Sulfotelmatobacter sp.]|nr:glycosyltransferase family 1 protein [Candidatus Sulfotelmatobacter sp.]
MMRLFINSLAASAGGGLTYIRNILPHLAARSDVQVTVALNSGVREEFRGLPTVEILELQRPVGRRFWHEQMALPAVIRASHADLLLSTGNFALRSSPVPQILLSRNSIYTSADFYRDLRSRHEYRAWLDTRLRSLLAKRSIHWAQVTVAPSEAFAAELQRWTGVRVQAIHHGFDPDAFTQDASPLPPDVEEKLRNVDQCFKLLLVSHYNYYRNFETLIRALPLLRDRVQDRPIKLVLTCRLEAGQNPGAYRPEAAAKLVRTLGVSDMIVELGAIPYSQLHQLYASADLYVTPAYTETFAHPLVEAMASGVPVVASDLAIHREICGEAAVYFPRFSAEALAEKVLQVSRSPEAMGQMAAKGREQSHQFSWKRHVEKIVELCASLITPKVAQPGAPLGDGLSKNRFHATSE